MLLLEHLSDLYLKHKDCLVQPVSGFDLGGEYFNFQTSPTLMGVINLSPDSWYRESVCLSPERAIERGIVLHAQGARILDLGAESTLAHASLADQAEQCQKLTPVIQGLRRAGITVSVETYLAPVARACLEAGANILNLTGLAQIEEIYPMAAENGAGVILCYVQGETARAVKDFEIPTDPIGALYEYFARECERASRFGVHKLILDPGLGFYYRNLTDGPTRVRYQMNAFLNSFRLHPLGFPICNALPHAFEFFGEEIRSAEPFFTSLAALGGTHLFRTHEVSKVKAVLDTLDTYEPLGRQRKTPSSPD
jgi:dihydropteroate synthase